MGNLKHLTGYFWLKNLRKLILFRLSPRRLGDLKLLGIDFGRVMLQGPRKLFKSEEKLFQIVESALKALFELFLAFELSSTCVHLYPEDALM